MSHYDIGKEIGNVLNDVATVSQHDPRFKGLRVSRLKCKELGFRV